MVGQNNVLEMGLEENGHGLIQIISEHLPGLTEENHENLWPVERSRFEPRVIALQISVRFP
jgi:hypothetical protein